jgi:hypothetical protein
MDEYGMCWLLILLWMFHCFVARIQWSPKVTSPSDPGRPLPICRRMAHPICISWRSAGGSGYRKKLEPCDVSGGSSSISHDSSFWGWHMTPVLCIDVSTVSHVILMGFSYHHQYHMSSLVVCLVSFSWYPHESHAEPSPLWYLELSTPWRLLSSRRPWNF